MHCPSQLLYLEPGSMYKNPPTSDIEVLAENSLDLFDESMAHSLKVKPLEKDIINIEPVLKRIVQQMDELYNTERLMRDTNGTIRCSASNFHCVFPLESTNERVRYLSVISILTLVALGLFQLYYLKRYFKSKKLI
jgi:p24 family protein delta-1